MAGIYFDNTMRYIKPDFYDDFRCIASACRHSCCAGWEIDIDEDTADYYAELSGAIGGELRAHISAEPEPHFVMTEDGRCPFLCGDGLCRLILTLGEDALCDICAEHPRFYNFTGGREESGLGLCCEEVVRLLYSSDAPIGFIAEDDGGPDEDSAEENEIYLLRGKILHTLADRAHLLHQRMAAACALCGAEMPPLDMRRWAEFYSGLERMHKRGARNWILCAAYTPLPCRTCRGMSAWHRTLYTGILNRRRLCALPCSVRPSWPRSTSCRRRSSTRKTCACTPRR